MANGISPTPAMESAVRMAKGWYGGTLTWAAVSGDKDLYQAAIDFLELYIRSIEEIGASQQVELFLQGVYAQYKKRGYLTDAQAAAALNCYMHEFWTSYKEVGR
jgi:hypothetical protein